MIRINKYVLNLVYVNSKAFFHSKLNHFWIFSGRKKCINKIILFMFPCRSSNNHNVIVTIQIAVRISGLNLFQHVSVVLWFYDIVFTDKLEMQVSCLFTAHFQIKCTYLKKPSRWVLLARCTILRCLHDIIQKIIH